MDVVRRRGSRGTAGVVEPAKCRVGAGCLLAARATDAGTVREGRKQGSSEMNGQPTQKRPVIPIAVQSLARLARRIYARHHTRPIRPSRACLSGFSMMRRLLNGRFRL